MSAAMNVLKGWQGRGILPPEKRKRPTAETFFESEDPRKRAKAEYEREQRAEEAKEYKIRGRSASAIGTGMESGASPSSPQRGEQSTSRDSLASPLVQEDRQQFINATSTSTSISTSTLQSNRTISQSPLSRSPEYVSDVASAITEDLPERRQLPKNIRPPHSCPGGTESPKLSSLQLKQPKALRVDTTKAIDNLDPTSPAYTPSMAGEPLRGERLKHAFSFGRAPQSYDIYPKSGSPLSRRQSEGMGPPNSAGIKPPRSESSTPKPATPTTKEILLPRKRDIQSQAPLLDTLTSFAQSIQSSASLTTRRDLAAHQLAVQDKDRQRQQRYRDVFTTLVEDAESKFDTLDKSSANLAMQADQKSAAQALISGELAARMQTAESQVPTPATNGSDPSRNEKALREELAQLRNELEEARKDMKSLRHKVCFRDDLEQVVHKIDLEGVVSQDGLEKSLRGIVRKDDLRRLVDKDSLDGYMTKYGLEPMESKLAEHKAEIIRVDKDITEVLRVTQQQKQDGEQVQILNDKHFDAFTKSITIIEAKMSEIGHVTGVLKQEGMQSETRNVKCFEDLTTSVSRTQAKLSDIEHATGLLTEEHAEHEKKLLHQQKSLTKLTDSVHGDDNGEELGLNKIIDTGSQDIVKIQDSIEDLRDSIQALTESHSGIATSVEQYTAQPLVGSEPRVAKDLEHLREDFDQLLAEQKGKDDCVSSDLEKLENMAKVHEYNIELLREELRRIDGDLAKQSPHSLPLTTTSRPTQPPTPPLQSRAFTPQEPDRIKIHEVNSTLQELKDQTNALETVFSAQQQKFDGLTSDYVVSCMVNRMMQIYPHHPNNLPTQVAQLQIQITQISQRQGIVDHFLLVNLSPWRMEADKQLAARAAAETQMLKTRDNKDAEVNKHLNDVRAYLAGLNTRLTTLQNNIDGEKASDLNRITRELVNIYGDQIKSLFKQVNETEIGYKKAVGQLATSFASVKESVQDLDDRIRGLPRASGQAIPGNRSHDTAPDFEQLGREIPAAFPDSRELDGWGPLEDSDAPLSGRKGQSNGDIYRESSEEEPLSSRRGHIKDLTPTSALKRKRHTDTVSLLDDDSGTRRTNGKGPLVRLSVV